MKNKNLTRGVFVAPLLQDGTVKVLPVDQFPTSNKGIVKDDGFPMSDIGILDRFSQDLLFDDDFVKMVAQRVEPISENVSSLTLEQEIKALRPSWVQTPSEYAAYSERVFDALKTSKTDEVTEVEEKFEEIVPTEPIKSE